VSHPLPVDSAGSDRVGCLLAEASAVLERAGVDQPRANAELLLAWMIDVDRGWLFVNRRERLDPALASRFADWVRRRARREPLQHVVGRLEFYGLSLACDRRALVPRPETEGLVGIALGLEPPRGARIADLGTGGGCIALALAVARPDLRIVGLDLSTAALDLARENARRLGLGSRVRFVAGDFARPPRTWRGQMHLVVANPPYGSESEWPVLEPEVRDHDPREAFVAGPTGLEAYQALAAPAYELLRPGGALVLELGAGQSRAVAEIATGAGFAIREVRRDFQGIDRVLVARRPGPGRA